MKYKEKDPSIGVPEGTRITAHQKPVPSVERKGIEFQKTFLYPFKAKCNIANCYLQ